MRGATASAIAASIENGIREGAFAPGGRLPTVRELAVELGVSPATIAAAFRSLRLRGLLTGEGRRGTRVAHRPALPTGTRVAVATGLRNLADGNPDPALLPRLPALPRAAVRLYGEPAADPDLARLIRERLDAEGIPGEIAVVSGGLDGIERILLAHLAVGDRVAVEDPGFSGLLDLLGALGLVAEPVEVDDSGLLPDSLERVARSRVKALVLTPRAQNPTGAALDADRAKALRAVLDRHPDLLVVEDDHAGPVAGADLVTLCPRPRHWALVRSVSKSLGPDLRVAILVGDATTIARVEGRQHLGAGWVSHVLQRAVAAMGRDATVAARIATAASAYAERRAALLAALRRHGVAAHARSGFNVWIPVAEEASVVAALAARGWAVRAGEPYRLRSAPAVRVTAATLLPREAGRFADDLATCLRPSSRFSTTR